MNKPIELDELPQSYFDLVENASDVIYFHDASGVLLFVNRKAEELTGYDRSELIHKHISVILKENSERVIREKLRKHKSLRWDKKFELDIKTRDGAMIPVELSMSPIVRQRRLIGFEGIARDIRERREAQQLLDERDARIHQLNLEIQHKSMKLEEATRVQSEFVANISHEFRNPLNGIIGYTELLLDGVYGELDSHQQNALQNVKSCAGNLLQMVQEVLDLSRLKNNQLRLESEFCSPQDLVEATVGTIGPIAKRKEIRLTPQAADDLPLIQIDFRRIYQVFVNLASNAVKFAEGGDVEIGAELDGGEVKFYVKDSGIGISPEMRDLIVVEFQEGSETDSTYGTSALGLNVARRVVELHNGRFGIEAMGKRGCKYYFTIPVRNLESAFVVN